MLDRDAPREWFAIRTKPQQEQVDKLHYKRQGYVVYLPMMRTIVWHVSRTMAKLKLFLGYLSLSLTLPNATVWRSSPARGVLGRLYVVVIIMCRYRTGSLLNCRPREKRAELFR